MPTTTLKLPEELKERIAAVAVDAGGTPRPFMAKALAERRRTFANVAMTAEQEVADYGLVCKCDVERDVATVLAVRHQCDGGFDG